MKASKLYTFKHQEMHFGLTLAHNKGNMKLTFDQIKLKLMLLIEWLLQFQQCKTDLAENRDQAYKQNFAFAASPAECMQCSVATQCIQWDY